MPQAKVTTNYEALYQQSIDQPEQFWAKQAAANLTWMKKWQVVMWHDFSKIGTRSEPYVKFFDGGRLNVSVNCLDRHVAGGQGRKAAIIWHSDDGQERKTISYSQLLTATCRFANVLKKHGVKKGDVVTIYLPMIPEAAIAMLACSRIGAIHSVVFSAFSATPLNSRLIDGQSKTVITADASYHAGKTNPLKKTLDKALKECSTVKQVIVVKRGPGPVTMKQDRDFWWHDEINAPDINDQCQPAIQESEDPLFILYTSGSTGQPKGVLHTTAGYLLYAHLTFKHIFDVQLDDIHYCTADVGWITGHSYVVYGPLSNGVTTVMFEGSPTHPAPNRFWQIIEQDKVSIFYTAPTAIRSLMRLGDAWPQQHDLSSLKVLGTVGEPINPSAWLWYWRIIGRKVCPVLDTWWQTETGGIMIAPLPGATALKPGSATKPFFGIAPAVLKADGTLSETNKAGSLVITKPWPGMIRGVFGDHKNKLIKKNYFSQFPGLYYTGDGARVDRDGDFWLLGRLDDVINVSAHRFTSAEIEHALTSYPGVTEAAVVGVPDDITGQALHAFVTLAHNAQPSPKLQQKLYEHVRAAIGPIAKIKHIQFTAALPKTRSGKIMRRLLRAVATGHPSDIGDTTTLADPSVIKSLTKTTDPAHAA